MTNAQEMRQTVVKSIRVESVVISFCFLPSFLLFLHFSCSFLNKLDVLLHKVRAYDDLRYLDDFS